MIDRELLLKCAPYLNERAVENFDRYAYLLLQKNKVMNLTGITQPDEIVIKHFSDSLKLCEFVHIKENSKVIDVGTGAGFPGLPLLIARNDIKLTLLDSLNKRLVFLSEVLEQCNLNAQVVHSRAEDAGRDEFLRETFDVATARAVAPLNILCEYCLPFVKKDGIFAALKGPTEDVDSADKAIALLGGEVTDKISYKLENGDKRMMIIIKKISQTPTIYPRKGKKITVKPL